MPGTASKEDMDVKHIKYTVKRTANIIHPTTRLARESRALHLSTGVCTRLVGFAPDDWPLHPTLGFAPETTRLCTQLLCFAQKYWAFNNRVVLHSTTGLSSEYQGFTHTPIEPTQFRPMYTTDQFPIEFPAMMHGILPYERLHAYRWCLAMKS